MYQSSYYLLEPVEVIRILGIEAGEEFNRYFDISQRGNFEGKNIPNLLKSERIDSHFEEYKQTVYEYRKNRYALNLDDKILTSWNGLMIAAMCHLYRITGNKKYLNAAVNAQEFIESQLCEKAITDFYDKEQNGFFLYGKDNEQLILRPKETYDGAVPSGNSTMAYNLVRLYLIIGEKNMKI